MRQGGGLNDTGSSGVLSSWIQNMFLRWHQRGFGLTVEHERENAVKDESQDFWSTCSRVVMGTG